MKTDPSSIEIKDFTYSLAPHQIAEFPLAERDASRLLIYKSGKLEESIFKKLASHLPENASLFANNTRVIEARILFQKPTGGVIEVFCLEPFEEKDITRAMHEQQKIKWRCLIGGASKWKHGQLLHKEISIEGNTIELSAAYIAKETDAFIIEFSWWPSHYSFADILHVAGSMPLPPYIKRKAELADEERYQTIFAQEQGSVAAPTAALHFTKKVFADLRTRNIQLSYLTLHVGAGTFKPVKTETINAHQMHAEQFHISLKALENLKTKRPLIAVGTTTLRTLESLYWMGIKLKHKKQEPFILQQWEAYELEDDLTYEASLDLLIAYLKKHAMEVLFGETSLLIFPGYPFKSADALITNFHQPQSTLLLLIAAFIGEDWKELYNYALQNNFRFLSYGDSNLLWRSPA